MFLILMQTVGLPEPVQSCVAAVRADDIDIAARCAAPAGPPDFFAANSVPRACVVVLDRGRSYAQAQTAMADQPMMLAGIRRDFDEKVASCEAALNAPNPTDDRRESQRLWN